MKYAVKNKKSPPSSFTVTQSNKLIEARYNLPLGEQRLILTMISKIQLDDEDFKEYRINVGEFAEFLGIDKNSVYREFHKIQKSIVSRVLVFYESDGPLVVGWVSSAKYLEKEGAVLLSFDPKLKPYLLQLKGNFTSCRLEMLLSFKSQYTARIYNLLKQYELFEERLIEVDSLREILGLRVDQYKLYANFKTDLLKYVQKELKSKADLYFEFTEVKYGRKVGAIRFRIFKKIIKVVVDDDHSLQLPALVPSQLEASIASSVDALLLLVPESHRVKKTVQAAIVAYEKKHDFEYVKRNILYSNVTADKSYAGFLNGALKEDWGHDWSLDQKEVSVRKKGRLPWERNGFKSQKEYDDHMHRKQMEAYGHKV